MGTMVQAVSNATSFSSDLTLNARLRNSPAGANDEKCGSARLLLVFSTMSMIPVWR
jgi:hypothetical protein